VNFRTRKEHMEELFRLLQQECLALLPGKRVASPGE